MGLLFPLFLPQDTVNALFDFLCGVYIGEYDVNFIYAKVEVTVQNGEITNINILEHRNERGKHGLQLLLKCYSPFFRAFSTAFFMTVLEFVAPDIASTSIFCFFKTAGMKPIGKIVCAGTASKKELPKQTIKKIERCMK